MIEICSNMQRDGAGAGGGEKGEQMLVARATEGLFWASDFADEENHFPAVPGRAGPPSWRQ